MSTISASTTSTTAYKITADTTGTLVIQTGATPTTAVTIDTSQNVGIGTSSPVVALDVYGAVNLRAGYNLTWGGTYASNKPTIFADTNYIAFAPVGASSGEKMRIDSSGNLLVGTATKETRGVTLYGTGANGFYVKTTGTSGYLVTQDGTGGAGTYLSLYSNTTNTGSITTNGTTTTYGTTSDYRLKENVTPMTGALAKVAALKPVTYTWKETGKVDEGFIAHELQEICPSAAYGEKDAVDANGNPIYQGIDTSFLVATLTAAIQELKAELDAAKTDIATLKGAA